MNRFVANFSSAAALALAAMPFVAFVAPANAQAVRIPAGDAAHFEQRIDIAARTLCAHDIRDLGAQARYAACRQAVREEAVAALAQRQVVAPVDMAAN